MNSPGFYSDAAYHAKIKNPTEYVVTALRTLDAPFSAANNSLLSATRTMGQELFSPPNVKGWPGGKTWMNTMTLITRVNFASGLTYEMNRHGLLSAPRLRHGIAAYGTAPGGLNDAGAARRRRLGPDAARPHAERADPRCPGRLRPRRRAPGPGQLSTPKRPAWCP